MIKRIVFIFLIIVSCSKDKSDKVDVENNVEDATFINVSSDLTGIDFSNDLQSNGQLNIIEYLYYYNGGGVAVGDINNDGLDDIYLSANEKPDKLYLNLGNLKFKDISVSSGISQDATWSTGVAMADVNNDGFLDIYVCKVGNYKGLKATNELYINNGDNTFKEEAKAYGVDFSGFSTQSAFFDYDNDGDLDMYLMNHSVHSPYSYGNAELRSKSDALAGDVFYENISENNQTKFVDVTKQTGIYNSAIGYGLAIATADINNDGFMDVYIGNDFHENDYLYINNGNKTFTESSDKYFNHTSRFTMGVDIADITNDGNLDIVTLDMMPYKSDIFLKSGGEDSDKVNQIKKSFGFQQQYARNHLQLNKGNHFVDASLITDTYATDWSWSPLIFDYNNDGLNDLYITNGIYKRPNDLDYINYLSNFDFAKYAETTQDSLELKLINTMPMLNLPNALLKNKGDLAFERTLVDENNTSTYSNGAAFSDLDLDGDLDIVVNNINAKASVLENKTSQSTDNNYLSINLFESNKSLNTTGAKIYVYADGKQFFKEQSTIKGFLSSSTRQVHFGLGNITKVDSLRVIWKDRTQSLLTDLKLNTIVNVNKGETTNYNYESKKEIPFNVFNYEHKENSFLDYEREALIPENLSIEGPSVVQADFNADGLQDLFIGGARNQAPVLYMQNKNGTYSIKDIPAFHLDNIYEDVDAIAFDIDADNDLDIYALSAGNDHKEGDPMLEDRVYINDGNGNFTKLNSNLLATNGGTVSNFDFDNDGLQDLFIGNRSIPGAYGLSPFSFILKNKGQNSFEIVLKRRFGMLTDSKWADLDNDGNIELIIAGDWMPILIFSYNKSTGKFDNKTQQFGLDKTYGMWNVINVADINEDGKLDIIAGNTGLNFKWKASVEKPVKIYLDDFDKNEQLDQLIFYDFFGTYVPFASKDKLVQQIPSLKKKFLNYNTFSKVETVFDLTQKNEADILETKYIYELRSMIYLNNGTNFKPQPLPKQAQLSTIEDVLVDNNQIIFTGNYYGFTTELGQSSSNPGGVISSSVKDNFEIVKSLHLPKDFSGRKIVKLKEGQYLVIGNNGKSYLVN
ncbi:VCBS repeat-containing protein [Sabulilitoribacter multivorans]|uniref:VCBS repeat-containing protein n=1 Tax=Flaviramulus multivorans TaxID=1304750 RepID=A0ABS9IIZ2_9FLAO|nr:VCBS repeat-containing protein [Flaviramulus multivorans]MCF7560468.1 VCBS repeat-containing protein [Flaviramulus multivorans]